MVRRFAIPVVVALAVAVLMQAAVLAWAQDVPPVVVGSQAAVDAPLRLADQAAQPQSDRQAAGAALVDPAMLATGYSPVLEPATVAFLVMSGLMMAGVRAYRRA